MSNQRFPEIPKDLLEFLEAQFPDLVPAFDKPNEEKCFLAGQVAVVRLLRHRYTAQQTQRLESTFNVHG
jgi:hypothetical protein